MHINKLETDQQQTAVWCNIVQPTLPAQGCFPAGGQGRVCEPCGQSLKEDDVDNRLNLSGRRKLSHQSQYCNVTFFYLLSNLWGTWSTTGTYNMICQQQHKLFKWVMKSWKPLSASPGEVRLHFTETPTTVTQNFLQVTAQIWKPFVMMSARQLIFTVSNLLQN